MKAQSDLKNRYVIIMAGGRGERFWPVSRQKTPKQLITLLGNRSFLQRAVDHVLPVVPRQNILVITNAVQAPTVRRQLPELPRENIVAEPCGRDTCAAVTLGAALVGARSPNRVMAVLPADHVIPEAAKFQTVLSDALDLAAQNPIMITIGIKPTEPATGYGYIHMGPPLPSRPGRQKRATAFFQAQRFVEKPSRETATAYLKSGEYRWNAGMFIWSYATIFQGLEHLQPQMAAACQRWKTAAGTGKIRSILAKDYPGIKKISVDFALMEKADNVVVADGDFAWDDLGSWTALARHLPADAAGNCAVGQTLCLDASRNIIFDARRKRGALIALIGIHDSIIVHTDDATLVAHKDQAQRIKELVARLADQKEFHDLV